MNGKSIRQQFADTMLDVGRLDPRLVVLVGDISHNLLKPYASACPGRYFNVGICEQTIVGMAAGLAKVGFYPVVHTIAPFLVERSFEQLKLDFSYQGLGGNLVTSGSAFDYSNLGCSHHCYGDFALLKTLENTAIIYPGSPLEFDLLFRQTYRDGRLTVFRVPARQHGYPFQAQEILFGKAIRVTLGRGLTIVVTGPQLKNALDAREDLSRMGLEPEIVYVPTIQPLDTDTIHESALKTRRVMVVEEHMERGGLGDDVLRSIRTIPGCEFTSLSIPNSFVTEYGSYEDHCRALGLTREGIIQRAGSVFSVGAKREEGFPPPLEEMIR